MNIYQVFNIRKRNMQNNYMERPAGMIEELPRLPRIALAFLHIITVCLCPPRRLRRTG